jgi:hypothetical protein
MKLGIMQPYFFPYLGYFSLIKHTDQFILFDPVQFIRHGWIERNKILKMQNGWQYVSVPLVKHSRDTKIKNIEINNTNNWRNTILSKLEIYKRRAPYYKDTLELIYSALDIDTDSIVTLNKHSLETICDYIGIDCQVSVFSEMELILDEVKAPDEWALNICKAMGAKEYWNPIGGLEFMNRQKYEDHGIKIDFMQINFTKYPQKRPEFEPSLSIIDVLMFNEPSQINNMLDDFVLL